MRLFLSFVFSPEEEPEKEKKSKKQSKKEEVVEEDVENDHSEEEEEKTEDTSGSESPRTSALRAMGGNAAANIIDMMSQQPEIPYYPSSDGLHTITEENELESSGSLSRPPETVSMAPSITITTPVIHSLVVKNINIY